MGHFEVPELGVQATISDVFLSSLIYGPGLNCEPRAHMKVTLAVFWLLACITSAAAQNGVSNARDGNGNLIRDNGMRPTRSYDQVPVNNPNGANRAPAPRPAAVGNPPPIVTGGSR